MSAGRYLVYATIVSTFVLIVWGAYLTAGNWGGACGGGATTAVSADWPYCNGSLAVPNPYSPASYGAFVEYFHRTLSVLVGVILVATLVSVSRMKPRPSGAYRALLLSGVLLLVQIGLGNVVVNSDLNAAVTALHLANATALFGVMVISGVLIRQEERPGGYY
ncbi:MAG TPA: COX15/CtaA family protein [Nitrososphaerales archaeon]|nr:COX15/CtaA family protein [Nitrososphaerales archaeon]